MTTNTQLTIRAQAKGGMFLGLGSRIREIPALDRRAKFRDRRRTRFGHLFYPQPLIG